MTAAVLTGLAVWLLVPSPATHRVSALCGDPPAREGPTPRQWLMIIVPILCLTFFGLLTGAVIALVATPATIALIGGLETSAARRRSEAIARELPRALDLLAAVLEAGRDPGTAFTSVAEVTPQPLSQELSTVAARVGSGADLASVWSLLARHRDLGSVGRAFRRASESGVSIAQVIAQTAEDARRRQHAAARVRSRGVGVRTAVPMGVCFLPAFFCVGIGPTLIGLFSSLDVLP